jgi:hypothetical protein
VSGPHRQLSPLDAGFGDLRSDASRRRPVDLARLPVLLDSNRDDRRSEIMEAVNGRNRGWRVLGGLIGFFGFGVGLALFFAREPLLIVLGAVILVGSQIVAFGIRRRYPVRSRL